MAKRKNKIEDYFNISFKEFKKMDYSEQKRITSKLVSAMNKRIKRLGEYVDEENNEIGKLSPTYQAYEKRGSYYSIKDKTGKTLSGDALYNKYEQLVSSLKRATSVREWKKLRNETLTELNLEDIDIETEKAFWSMYRKFQEEPARKFKKYKKEISGKILSYIASTFEKQGYDYTEKTKAKIKRWLKREYEKDQRKKAQRNRERSASTFIPDEESE